VVRNQADSLRKLGTEVLVYEILGKGVAGYLKHLFRLRRYIRRTGVSMVHAHYGLSGILASLAGARPLVVSLMGSDLYLSGFMRFWVRLFSRFFWSVTIVKSDEMFRLLGNPRAKVLPNGVDLDLFKEMPREEARERLGFTMPRNIIWASDPVRKVKNFLLAREACLLLNCNETELQVVKDVDPGEMALYLNASDVLLLTSHWEGSPNVVKEALACNIPVVSTPVGDVEGFITGVSGCLVCPPNAKALALGLEKALAINGRSNGRERILPLDSRLVAGQILSIYNSLLKKPLSGGGEMSGPVGRHSDVSCST
jgi:glycosyltransferase involved in cell wall biosynthesis